MFCLLLFPLYQRRAYNEVFLEIRHNMLSTDTFTPVLAQGETLKQKKEKPKHCLFSCSLEQPLPPLFTFSENFA